MRRTLASALVVAALALSGCDGNVPGPGEAKVDVDTPQLRALKADAGIEPCAPGDATDSQLPAVTLPCLGGGDDVDLSGLRGPLVVNVWASWCGPCRDEMPALAAFYDEYGERVPVVGIDYQDRQSGPALELAKKSGVTYPLLADPQGDLRAQDPFPASVGVPSFVFVAEDGSVTIEPGGVSSKDELVDLVRKHLGIDL